MAEMLTRWKLTRVRELQSARRVLEQMKEDLAVQKAVTMLSLMLQ